MVLTELASPAPSSATPVYRTCSVFARVGKTLSMLRGAEGRPPNPTVTGGEKALALEEDTARTA